MEREMGPKKVFKVGKISCLNAKESDSLKRREKTGYRRESENYECPVNQ